MPKLSIITINLNNKAGLEKTINSVLGQSYKDYQFIIIDGGSSDGSKAVLEHIDNKNTIVISEKDNGIYDAMNKGINLAKGEYLLFLNSGDSLNVPTTLSEVFSKEIETDILYGNMWIEYMEKRELGEMPENLTPWHFYIDTLWHPVSFIKKKLFENLGPYNENYSIVADYDFFFNAIVVNKARYKHLNIIISSFNTNGISSDKKNIDRINAQRREIQRKYLNKRQLAFF